MKNPYKCTENTWTIGHGSTVIYTRSLPPKHVTPDTAPMNKAEARWNLIIYLDKAMGIAKLFIRNFDDLSEVRQYALAMMAYQLGIGLHGFKNTRYLIESGAFKQAADEMLDSAWFTQTPERARKMAYIFQKGQWPE